MTIKFKNRALRKILLKLFKKFRRRHHNVHLLQRTHVFDYKVNEVDKIKNDGNKLVTFLINRHRNRSPFTGRLDHFFGRNILEKNIVSQQVNTLDLFTKSTENHE